MTITLKRFLILTLVRPPLVNIHFLIFSYNLYILTVTTTGERLGGSCIGAIDEDSKVEREEREEERASKNQGGDTKLIYKRPCDMGMHVSH